jgi:hypothetical protein
MTRKFGATCFAAASIQTRMLSYVVESLVSSTSRDRILLSLQALRLVLTSDSWRKQGRQFDLSAKLEVEKGEGEW